MRNALFFSSLIFLLFTSASCQSWYDGGDPSVDPGTHYVNAVGESDASTSLLPDEWVYDYNGVAYKYILSVCHYGTSLTVYSTKSQHYNDVLGDSGNPYTKSLVTFSSRANYSGLGTILVASTVDREGCQVNYNCHCR